MATETRIFLEKAIVVVMNNQQVLSPKKNVVRKGGETEPKVAPLRALFPLTSLSTMSTGDLRE
jgi:hypothetical protein